MVDHGRYQAKLRSSIMTMEVRPCKLVEIGFSPLNEGAISFISQLSHYIVYIRNTRGAPR